MRGKRLWTIAIVVFILGFVAPAYLSAQEETPMASQTAGDDALHEFTLCERLKAKKSMLWGQSPGVIYSDNLQVTGRIQPSDHVRILTPNNREDGTVRVQIIPVEDRSVGRSGGRVWIDWASLVRSNTEHLMFECESTTVLTGEEDQIGKMIDDSVTFRVRIENVSGDSELPTILAPGIWVLHSEYDPLFTRGEKDRGHGLEALAEDGYPSYLADALIGMGLHAGVFKTPVGASSPGPLWAGGSYEFEVEATPDSPYLSFAFMFVQSNDLFLATDGRGIALFDEGGTALAVHDATSHLLLWDAGTEANEEPGVGPNQAPRQSAANIGPVDENETVHPVDDKFVYPDVTALVKVSIIPILTTGYAPTQEETPTATPIVTPELPLASILDGTWLVGQEIAAGIYSAPGGAECSWKRLSGFGGTSDDVIASASGAVRPIVEIAPTDRGFSTSNCGQWAPVPVPPTATPAPPSRPVMTPTPAASKTPTTLPMATATPFPRATVEIPRGWKQIEDDRLGYSLAVPFPWVTFDLKDGFQNPIVDRLIGEEALVNLRQILESPYVTDNLNIGIMAIEPDLSQLLARPPFPMFLNVSRAHAFDEFRGDALVEVVKLTIETFSDVQLQSVEAETVNGWPAVQAVVSLDLRRLPMEIDLKLHFVFTFVQANQKTYLLTIVTRSEKAETKQGVIDQIVGTLLPEGGVPEARSATAPTSAATQTPVPTLTPIATLAPTARPTPTRPPTPTPTVTPAPTPFVTIPQGWNQVVNERLGYSLAVPRGWIVLDVHSGRLSQILRFIDPGAAEEAGGLLSAPGAENAGHVAVRIEIFSRPPIKSVAGVGIVPLDDGITVEGVVKQLRDEIESFDMVPVKVLSLKAGTTNNLPSIQGAVTADLSDHGLFEAHAVMTALLANDKAYILFVAIPAKDAEAMQQQIDQIVGSFRPE